MPLPRATIACFIAAFLAVGCAATLVGDLAAATPKQRIAEKQAEARSVLDQVDQLDRRLEANVEAWNGARIQLAATRHQLAFDRVKLRVAERARERSVARVKARLVALYESDDNPTALGILLGAATLSDMLDRLDAAHQIAASDHSLAVQATQARDRAARLAYRTSALEQQQAATFAHLNGEHEQISSMLNRRRQLLSSVQSEVKVLQAQEARRQARLAAEARARLAAEAAARAAAAAQAKAAEEAAAKAAARTAVKTAAATPPPTTSQAADPPPTTTAPSTPAPPATTTTAAPAPAAPATPAALGPGHPEAAQIALRYLGVKYVWGGASPDGFDCSGLVMYVYAQLGIQLPHFAAAQYALGQAVPRDQLQAGDLVFFDGLDHVGIYIGGGQMVHAPQTGDVVKITPLSAFGNRYVGARRL
jgi:cell wall-associated NlpC family hydrolase